MKFILRILILFIGLVIAHFGVTLFLLSNLGADPFNVLIQGLFRTASSHFDWKFLSHGNVHMAVSFLIILVLLVCDRSYIKIGTIICMFCGGPIIDFFTWLILKCFGNDFSFVLAGFILGGTFGPGTIVCAFLVGPVADIFLPINEKIISRIL